MTGTLARLAGFALALAALFGIGVLAGGVLDASPPDTSKASAEAEHPSMTETGDTAGMSMGVRGLGVAQDGLRLMVDTPAFERGESGALRFRILQENGRALRDYDIEHTKRMHLIVVRRDLTGFQHLHPTQGADGGWRTPLRLHDAGSYRVFADFSHDGQPVTLASDLNVDGVYAARALPKPVATADADGYQVRLTEPRTVAGREAQLRFRVTRNGEPVAVEPYLGADGHLVALRAGDLAFLHVHPVATTGARGAISFDATFPTTGRYRLFLQFKIAGQVHTAAFTQEVQR